MQAEIVRDIVQFESSDSVSQIHGYIWRDASESFAPKGAVQIAHGMAEHIERYDDFARYLVRRGYVVCGHDHVGHGQSVADTSQWGHIPAKTGRDTLVNDLQRMRLLCMTQIPANTAYFMFGHSLGSYITRAYITEYAKGLSGAILCGTGHVPVATSKAGNLLARLICTAKGEQTRSKFLDNMSVGAYAKAIDDPRTELDWLSYDEDNIERYRADEACGFMFSAGGYATVTSLTGEVCSSASAAKIPHNLPMLFIAGIADPVGSCATGVRTAAGQAKQAGVADVTTIIYEHMRHEILNEAGHENVYEDIAAWLDAHCATRQKGR